MTTSEIKLANLRRVSPELNDLHLVVLGVLETRGAMTTRQLADWSMMLGTPVSIFTVRPRITELVQMGLVVLCGREGREGVYRAASSAEIAASDAARRGGLVSRQQLLL